MSTRSWIAAAVAACAALGFASTASAVTVNVYSGHGTSAGGAPFSGLVGSFESTDIQFTTGWHPFGLADFGAELFADILVGADGSYDFSMTSDDGSMLYIDGSLLIDNGGAHGNQTVSNSLALGAGLHSLRIEFFEDFGGESMLTLDLPNGARFVPGRLPEPGSLALLGLALAGVAATRRRAQPPA